MELNPIVKSKNKVSDEVYKILKSQIETAQIQPGERLPSENYLAEAFNVSRGSVRTALQKLEAINLIETVVGGGTYVKKFQFSDMLESISVSLSKRTNIDEIRAFRAIIEPASIELLRGKSIPSQDYKKLDKIFAEMKVAAKAQNLEEFAKKDFDFHLHICKMGGNSLVVYAYEMTKSLMLEYLSVRYSTDQIPPERRLSSQEYFDNALSYHKEIIDALKAKDIDLCINIVNRLLGPEAKNRPLH